tara:strand:- start:4293 stop:4487 length:195 start_codon:yes stop_codon:yes gene_type:complete
MVVMDIDEKEIARIFYMVKGHLVELETMKDSYNGYFKRLWGNHERSQYALEGFEEAYEKWKQTN